jgi:hypothetical protein
MADIRNSSGLCITCNNASGCFYLALRGPALFCELFDNYAPVAAHRRAEAARSSPGAPLPAVIGEDETGSPIGLCVNCDNLSTCMHPKPAGGVWHCEEYR